SGVQADVVTIAQAAVTGGVRRSHGTATWHTVQQALEQRPEAVPHGRAAGAAVLAQALLDALPQFRLDDGRVLAGMHLGLVADLARIGHVAEQLVQASLGEGPATPQASFAGLPALVHPAAAAQLFDYPLE